MEADLVLERAPKAAPPISRRSGIEHWLITHVAKLASEHKPLFEQELPLFNPLFLTPSCRGGSSLPMHLHHTGEYAVYQPACR